MKKIIKVLLILTAVCCVMLNSGPILTSGEINLGIIVGLGLAVICIIYVVLFDRINSFIRFMWQKKSGKVLISIVSAFIVTGIAVFSVTFFNVVTYGEESDKKTEYIIVLGCQVRGEEPGIYLRGRINKAFEYLTANPGSKAILSGGQGSDENISEGQCMYNTLTGMGIDGSRLIIEDESTSTTENFNNSVNNLKEQGTEINEITIVTNDFHEYRASKFAERCGLNAYSYPSETPFIGYTPFAVREVFAVVLQVYLADLF